MKPKLALNDIDVVSTYNTLGMAELLGCLIKSDLFEISKHNERIKVCKGERGALLYYNDKRVYVDFWEYALPTYSGEVYGAKMDLIIKLQDSNQSDDQIVNNFVRKNTFTSLTKEQKLDYWHKIVPWTFFCSRMMKQFIGKEEEIQKPIPIERLAFFCGKDWKCRFAMRDKLKKDGIEYNASSQEWRSMRPLTDDEYIQKMRSSKFGLILHGRGSYASEGKNRREIDYMMMKKPIIMNYKPYYYNELVPGKHYIYIDQNTDFNNLEKMYNVDEIAANGYQWYLTNASPEGAAKTFLQIMKDKFG